jgi:hypothetical protein
VQFRAANWHQFIKHPVIPILQFGERKKWFCNCYCLYYMIWTPFFVLKRKERLLYQDRLHAYFSACPSKNYEQQLHKRNLRNKSDRVWISPQAANLPGHCLKHHAWFAYNRTSNEQVGLERTLSPAGALFLGLNVLWFLQNGIIKLKGSEEHQCWELGSLDIYWTGQEAINKYEKTRKKDSRGDSK